MTWPPFLTGVAPDGAPYEPRTPFALYASHIGDYMRRWIVKTPWGTLRLHNILREDRDEAPHDHPFDFMSLILSGGYRELRCFSRDEDGWPEFSHSRWHVTGAVVDRDAEHLHLIAEVLPETWTLVVTSTKRRPWGFMTQAGWVPWRVYCGLEP